MIISSGFTDRWIEYCSLNSIPFIKVNCYDSNIIEILQDCSALMWHWNYEYYQDYLFAKQLLVTLNKLEFKVFPEFWTTFLFDDKLGQKYLFEALNLPIPKTYVFYEKKSAISWAHSIQYPIVFKLRCGAGSQNVQLVSSFSSANKLIKKAFSSGFNSRNNYQIIKDRYLKFNRNKNSNSLYDLIKSIYRLFIPKFDSKVIKREIGYVMFQEFLPNNDFDTRLIILGNRCFGITRFNRKNDFRASGSGFIDYDPWLIDLRAVKISFDLAMKLKTSLLALDYINDSTRQSCCY